MQSNILVTPQAKKKKRRIRCSVITEKLVVLRRKKSYAGVRWYAL